MQQNMCCILERSREWGATAAWIDKAWGGIQRWKGRSRRGNRREERTFSGNDRRD